MYMYSVFRLHEISVSDRKYLTAAIESKISVKYCKCSIEKFSPLPEIAKIATVTFI